MSALGGAAMLKLLLYEILCGDVAWVGLAFIIMSSNELWFPYCGTSGFLFLYVTAFSRFHMLCSIGCRMLTEAILAYC
jgi:hypothetical protein